MRGEATVRFEIGTVFVSRTDFDCGLAPLNWTSRGKSIAVYGTSLTTHQYQHCNAK
jgi:hypothetical protein